jgi:pullulanase/glycogen debranching enzyme
MPTASPLLVFVLLAGVAHAQPSDADRLRGYADQGDEVVFVFDPALYGLSPERVVVTGPFRAWSTNDAEAEWHLARGEAGLWTLAVEAEAARLGPAAPFKFRADGRWLDPPAGAENVTGGNLVYRFGEVPTRLVAELRGEDAVWVRVEGTDRPLAASAYRVERWDGEPVPVRALTPHEAETALLATAPLDLAQVHYVEAETEAGTVRAIARFDGLWRDLASAQPLGAVWIPPSRDIPADQRGTEAERWGTTTFRLVAPRADSVVLHLYSTRDAARPSVSVPMAAGPGGTWAVERVGDARGDWYDFSVYGPDGPGSAFTNQTGETVSDPYALVSDDSWGRARVWRDDFDPPQPVRGGRPAMEDVVAWEVHLQDATDELPVTDTVGPLEAFAMPGLTNSRGEPVGIDYIERLGVNVVHLMPVQEFLHYPDDSWRAAFADDPFMIEQGISDENYQWGYRTTHALAVESRFRSAGDEPGRERERLRDLVDAFHERGIAVVVDVVFNHTGENMEGVEQLLTFNGIDKWYYYRLDDDGNHIGAFGNEVKSENRPYTQRWLLDQLRQLVDVFGVDGFRIDLAGQTDEQTLRWLQAELGEDVLIYGEPWIGSNDPDYEANPSWDWYKADSPITFFQDDARNAFKGSPLDDPTPAPASRGFAGGDPEARDAALAGIANDYPEEPTPTAGINYLDIHDNWALADRFAACQAGDCAWDGREGVRAAEMRIAAALLMTSLGPVVMHGGTEIARSKGLAPLPDAIGGEWEREEMALAPIYIKGRGDTYNLRAANAVVWETVGNREGPVDHAAMFDWWRGLIALRLSEVGEVFRVGEAVPEGWVREVPSPSARSLGYVVGDRVLVQINTGADPAAFDVAGLGGEWRRVASSDADGGVVDLSGDAASMGPAAPVPGTGVRIWVRDE